MTTFSPPLSPSPSPIWRGNNPLMLASQSRARQTLLANAGVAFEAIPAEIDERGIQQPSGLSRRAIAALLAREKALLVSARKPGRYIVGADQALALGRTSFSKPDGRVQATEQLRALGRQSHELHSAVPSPAMARYCSKQAIARMTMRGWDSPRLPAISMKRGRGDIERRRLSAGRPRCAFVRADRRRSFHHPRAAPAALAGFLRGERRLG